MAKKRLWIRKKSAGFWHETGFEFMAKVTPRLSSHRRPSPALLLEDGVILEAANSLHTTIREQGKGTFSFWHDTLHFSSSDNTNPNENGRSYEIAYQANMWDNILLFFTKYGLVKFSGKPERSDRFAMDRPLEQEGRRFKYIPWMINLFRVIGIDLSSRVNILDFGCGSGELVKQVQDSGYRIYGCDIEFSSPKNSFLSLSLEKGIVRAIQQSPKYRIPFENNTFDIIYSFQVLEHVMDYETVFPEINRVLKPDGFCVHVFPGRYKFIEPHVYVPLATIVRSYWWLYLWALLGIRNEHQAGLSAKEVATKNFGYLREHTVYMTRKQILDIARKYFSRCYFCEEAFFPSLRSSLFIKFPSLLPVFRCWLSDTNRRVLVTRK